jgi:hypothetical protein
MRTAREGMDSLFSQVWAQCRFHDFSQFPMVLVRSDIAPAVARDNVRSILTSDHGFACGFATEVGDHSNARATAVRG